MPGKYDVTQNIVTGLGIAKSRRDEEYTNARRAIEDPIKDAELNRVNNARQSFVDERGVGAGDATTMIALQGNDRANKQDTRLDAQEARAAEMQPFEVEAQKIANLAGQQGIDATKLGAMGNLALKLGKAQADGQDIAPLIEQAKVAGGSLLDDSAIAMLMQASQTPEGLAGMGALYGKAAQISQIRSSRDGAGNERDIGIMDDGTTQDLGITRAPVRDPDADLRRQLLQAQIGSTNRANQPKPGENGVADPAARNQALTDIGEMRQYILDGKAKGVFKDVDQRDPVTNAAAAAANSGLGQMVQGFTDPEAQTIRDNIKAVIPRLASQIAAATGLTSRQLDTEKEYQRFVAQINNPDATVQSMLAALDALEARYLTGSFAPQGAAAPAAAPQVTTGKLAPSSDGSYTWTPGTD